MEMEMEIRFKKCGISNQPNVCIFDDPCLSKFGALHGLCPQASRQFLDFFVCPLRHQTTDGINAICCRIKHNRAKPMFESASAIFSIADAGEFRFARFYIVCEAVMHRNTKKSAHCLRLVGHTPEVSKRGRDTESDASIRQKEMHTFFSNECSICISS